MTNWFHSKNGAQELTIGRNERELEVVQGWMLSMSSRHAALSGTALLGVAGVLIGPARAQDLSASHVPSLRGIYAPELEPNAPGPSPADLPSTLQPRVTSPVSAVKNQPIKAPPNTFYQKPVELEGWMFDLAKERPTQVKTHVLGVTPGGRHIVALEIVPAGVTPWKMRRLVVLCRQHGNEPEASASGMRFIREFLTTTDPKKKQIAAKTALLIVPIANPDGAAVYRRRTNANVDMNRDWGHGKSKEIQILTPWIASWKPNLVVDVHQWLPSGHQPPPMAEASGGMLARQTAQQMSESSASHGYALAARSRWGLDTLCHRYWGQRFNIPAILLESRHRPTVPGARDVAIGTSLTALWSAAETVAK